MPEATEVLEWRGRTAVGADGSKLGKIEEIYLDAETQRPEWALIQTGMFGGKSSFMPLEGATSDGEQVTGALQQGRRSRTPRSWSPTASSPTRTRRRCTRTTGSTTTSRARTAGCPRAGRRPATSAATHREAGTVGHDTSGPTTDDAMTRSEEELRVGTTKRETGRARLVKHVVTENVTQTVPVRREEVRVEREPITDANRGDATAGGEITAEEHEVVLHEEEVVVDKQAVPKERVRLDKDVVTEEQQVSETVRKEQIETEGVSPASRR